MSKSAKGFDAVFNEFVEALAHLGYVLDVDDLLDKYAQTVPVKDARYINYCKQKCMCYWLREDFISAIEWGLEGSELKKRSGVDTQFDCDHALALARRDAGEVDIALKYFLKGKDVEYILGSATFEKSHGGGYYGNIGRCLQLKGDHKRALVCYRYSWRILDEGEDSLKAENLPYANQWIGEVLYIIGERDLSYCFFAAAKEGWDKISPPKARKIEVRINELLDQDPKLGLKTSYQIRMAMRQWSVGVQ